MRKIFLGIIFMLLLFSSFSLAEEDTIDVYVFYGEGCSHCSKMISFLEDIDYENVNIIEKEVYFDEENRDLLFSMAEEHNVEVSGVPMVFVDGQVFVGYSTSIVSQVENAIYQCSLDECVEGEVVETESSEMQDKSLWNTLTIPAVFSAALVDAINPCAFAVLVILLTTILVANNKKKALLAGLAFTLAIFISYFLMGLGLYSAIAASGLTRIFYVIVACLAIVIGLFNLKDYFWYGKFFKMEVPESWRPRMKSLIKGVSSVPGAFFIGFVVSLFLLPCTSGPYIVILGLLTEVATRSYAIFLLLLYNLIFVLPMVIITLLVYFGVTTTEKTEKWRTSKLEVLHLIAGLIILALGVGMFIAMGFGLI